MYVAVPKKALLKCNNLPTITKQTLLVAASTGQLRRVINQIGGTYWDYKIIEINYDEE